MHLALFDFDGTISSKDSTWDFITRACGKTRALYGFVPLSPVFLAYNLKRISHHEAKEAIIRHYFGAWDKGAFVQEAGRYARYVVPTIIRSEALQKVQWHLSRGHTVAVVTGSLEILLSHWCESLGIDLLATGIDLDSPTIGLSTRNCFQEEKARRIKEKYDLESFETISAYGDSTGDREMLALADNQYYKRFD
jgi:HAD superfamily hydrolase (TIGR01490 family)